MLGNFDPGCSWSSCKLSPNPPQKADQECIDSWDATTLAKHQHKVSELTFVQSSKSSQRLSQKSCEMKPQRIEWIEFLWWANVNWVNFKRFLCPGNFPVDTNFSVLGEINRCPSPGSVQLWVKSSYLGFSFFGSKKTINPIQSISKMLSIPGSKETIHLKTTVKWDTENCTSGSGVCVASRSSRA